jgi:hypothetical protein
MYHVSAAGILTEFQGDPMVDYRAFEKAQQPLLVSILLLYCDSLSNRARAQSNILQNNDGYQATYQQQTQNSDVSVRLLCHIHVRMQESLSQEGLASEPSALQTSGQLS